MGAKASKKSYEVKRKEEDNGKTATSVDHGRIQRVVSAGVNNQTENNNQTTAANHEEPNSDAMISAVLCNVNDLSDGQMKACTVEGAKVLVVRDNGQFHAVGGKCSHYGATLATGAYRNGRVRCPWHGACFDVTTGDIEDHPGLDSLPKFQTKIDGQSVLLIASKEQLENARRVKKSICQIKSTNQQPPIVIVGGGGAASTCAEVLRQEGYCGRVVMITREDAIPYDRPRLSKAPDMPSEKIALRSRQFYDENAIEIIQSSTVVSVNSVSKCVQLERGDSIEYSKLLVATGGRPRHLPENIPGRHLEGVCYLRSPQDGQRLAACLTRETRVVVIGSSFIGMELAGYASGKVSTVTVVSNSEYPLHVFGREMGEAILKLFQSKGVEFKLKSKLKAIEGAEGRVNSVVLADGHVITADIVIVGIGVIPATDFLTESGVSVDDRGFVPVDCFMKTNVKDVYAAGDIATFPISAFDLPNVNVQHWQMAQKHGHTAGLAMVDKGRPLDSVPFFWCMVLGKNIRYTGYGAGFDETIVHGNLDEYKCVVYYLKKGRVIAVASLARDPVCSVFAEIFLAKKIVTKDVVQKNPEDDWSQFLQRHD